MTFIKHYWSSQNGAVRERDLYKRIKDDVTSGPKAFALADALEKESRLYAALLNSEHEFWSGWGTAAKKNIEILSKLGLEQNRPMLLDAIRHMTRANTKKVLKATVGWSVRGLIVGGIGGGVAERVYCDAAVQIRAGEIKNTAQLLKSLSIIVPLDDQFEASFATARVSKAKLARYYLLALERGRPKVAEPELVPNTDEEVVNLEHVLPKNPDASDWPDFDSEARSLWAHRIGNLALLAKTANKNIGNQPFSKKRSVLASSRLELTKTIGAERLWTRAETD